MCCATVLGQNVHGLLLLQQSNYKASKKRVGLVKRSIYVQTWMSNAPAGTLQSVMAQENCSDASGEVLKSSVLLLNTVVCQCKLSSSMTLEFTAHHITDP